MSKRSTYYHITTNCFILKSFIQCFCKLNTFLQVLIHFPVTCYNILSHFIYNLVVKIPIHNLYYLINRLSIFFRIIKGTKKSSVTSNSLITLSLFGFFSFNISEEDFGTLLSSHLFKTLPFSISNSPGLARIIVLSALSSA